MHDILILAGFVCCEAVFHKIEHWFQGAEHKFRAVRHGAIMVWVFHPSVTSATAEWINHLLANALAAH